LNTAASFLRLAVAGLSGIHARFSGLVGEQIDDDSEVPLTVGHVYGEIVLRRMSSWAEFRADADRVLAEWT